jgi:hypothetical protein
MDRDQPRASLIHGKVWKQVFHAVWKTFRTRFDAILLNLQRHKQLLESQAHLIHWAQYREDRAKTKANFQKIQDEGYLRQQLAVSNWLCAANSAADQDQASSARAEYPRSGHWLLGETAVKKWMDPSFPLSPFLWVNGKPGAGNIRPSATLEVLS